MEHEKHGRIPKRLFMFIYLLLLYIYTFPEMASILRPQYMYRHYLGSRTSVSNDKIYIKEDLAFKDSCIQFNSNLNLPKCWVELSSFSRAIVVFYFEVKKNDGQPWVWTAGQVVTSLYSSLPCSTQTTDKRTDVWSRPSCICNQIFSPKKLGFPP